MKSYYGIIEFTTFGSCEEGFLVALEGNLNIPFEIKRVYYIWGNNEYGVRGKHAHKDLEQIVVCLSGSCDFILDDGKSKTLIQLKSPQKGLYIGNNVWREFQNFSKDCVVMVLASKYYSEEDYIRDYDEFLKVINE